MKTQEQIDARDRKELAQRKKQKNQKALKYGLLLTLLALFLASVTDEISSAIGVQVQSSVVTEFFVRPLNVPYNEAMAKFSTATTFSYALMALVPFYKALADKFGRKPQTLLSACHMCSTSSNFRTTLFTCAPHVVTVTIRYSFSIAYSMAYFCSFSRSRISVRSSSSLLGLGGSAGAASSFFLPSSVSLFRLFTRKNTTSARIRKLITAEMKLP